MLYLFGWLMFPMEIWGQLLGIACTACMFFDICVYVSQVTCFAPSVSRFHPAALCQACGLWSQTYSTEMLCQLVHQGEETASLADLEPLFSKACLVCSNQLLALFSIGPYTEPHAAACMYKEADI